MKARVIVREANIDQDSRVLLSERDSHHLSSVLRLKIQDEIQVIIPGKGIYNAWILAIEGRRVSVRVGELIGSAQDRESPLQVHVVMPFLKGDRMQWAVQKAVEAGAADFGLVVMDRSVVRPDKGGLGKRVARLQRVVESACEQSGRGIVPRVYGALGLQGADYAGKVVVMVPDAKNRLHELDLGDVRDVTLVTGPEGGFSDRELAWFQGNGWFFLRMGPRVFRAETAVVAGVIGLQVVAGDLG